MKTPVERPILILCGDEETYPIIRKSLNSLKSAKRRYPELSYFLNRHDEMRIGNVEAAKKALNPKAADLVIPVVVILDALVLHSDTPEASETDAAVSFMKWLDTWHPNIPVLVVAVHSTEEIERRVLARRNASLWRLNITADQNILAEALAGIAPSNRKGPPITDTRRITINVGRESASYRVSNGRYEFLSSSAIPYERRTALDKLMANIETFSPWRNSGPRMLEDRWYGDAITHGQKLFDVLIKNTVGSHLIEMLKQPAATQLKEPPKLDLRFEIDMGVSDYEKLFKLPFEFVNHEDFDGVLCSRIPMARRIRMEKRQLDDDIVTATSTAGGPLRVLFIDANVSGNVRLQKYKSPVMTKSYSFATLRTGQEELAILQKQVDTLGPDRMAPVDVIGQAEQGLVGDNLREAVRLTLTKSRYDIVHFCGHSITLDDGLTYLIFPGPPDQPLAIPISEIADWLRAGHCRMLVLSSCEGASALTAIETMRRGVECMLGFRWMVEEKLCVEYFKRFYESYLTMGQPFCESYRSACSQLQAAKDGSPAWASALAVLRD
ncbi:MAG: CHAT domain-containing protein [Paraburkholderia sp.]|uniref:CHAT domain-containing protein n=1 Tax=Paraburkholderia sp. TaxID=1926495 RepID=UPI003C38EBC2